MSLQNKMNKSGPKQEPWAVPHEILNVFEYVNLFSEVGTFAIRECPAK